MTTRRSSRGPRPPATAGPTAPPPPADRTDPGGGREDTLTTVAELTIPALIDGGAVDEVGPEALTMPGELVEGMRPVRLAGDHYTPVDRPPQKKPPGKAATKPPPLPLPGVTRTPSPPAPAKTRPPATGLKTSAPRLPPPLPPGAGRPPRPPAKAAARGGGGEPTVTMSPEDLPRDLLFGGPRPPPAPGGPPEDLPTISNPAGEARSPSSPPTGRAPAHTGDGPTSRWTPRAETVFLSTPPDEGSGTAAIGPVTGSRRVQLRKRRWREGRGLQGKLQDQRERQDRPARPRRRGPSLKSTLLLMGGVCAVLGFGTLAGRLVRQLRQERLAARAAAAAGKARAEGTLSALLQGAARYGEVLALQPADNEALRQRAALLSEARYELGGGAGDDGGLGEAAQAAVRLVQGESAPLALGAQAYLLLDEGDGDADGAAARVQAMAAGEEGPAAGLKSYLEGQLALLHGDDDEAWRATQRAVLRSPERALWRLRLAQLLRAQGRQREAHAAIGEILRQHPAHPGATIVQACEALASDRTLQRILDAHLPSPSGRGEGGEGQGGREPDRAAARSTSLPVRPSPDLAPLGRPLPEGEVGAGAPGQADLAEGWVCVAERALVAPTPDLAAARQALARAQKLRPPGALLLRERIAGALLLARDPAGAAAEAEALVKRAPRRTGAVMILGRALLMRGQAQAAMEAMQPLLSSEQPAAQLLRAQALWQLDETLEAQGVARRVEAQAEGAPRREAQLLLARAALRLDEREEARRLLQEVRGTGAAEAAADVREAEVLEAQLLLQARPPETARARLLLEAVLSRAPDQVEAHLLLARVLREQGHPRAAREQLQAALAIEDRPAARRELAALALDEGDPALARRQYEQLLGGDQRDPELLVQAARAYRLSGDPAGALGVIGQGGASIAAGRREEGEALMIEEARALLQLGRGADAVALLREPARTAHRAAVPALLLRALLLVPGGAAQAGRLLAGLSPALRRDPELQLAEAQLLLGEGEVVAAQLRLQELLQRLPPGLRGDRADLRAEALELLEQAKRR